MRIHNLKCWPSMFEAIERGEKRAEFRRNDRDFAVGDIVSLRRWDPTPYTPGNPFGYDSPVREHRIVITHIVHGGQFGIPEGFCMFSFRREDEVVASGPPAGGFVTNIGDPPRVVNVPLVQVATSGWWDNA